MPGSVGNELSQAETKISPRSEQVNELVASPFINKLKQKSFDIQKQISVGLPDSRSRLNA